MAVNYQYEKRRKINEMAINSCNVNENKWLLEEENVSMCNENKAMKTMKTAMKIIISNNNQA